MLANGIKEETTTTGTGPLTLTSVTGCVRFSGVFADGEQVNYAIIDADGKFTEAGVGTYTATNTLARTFPLSTYVSGTYDRTSPSAVDLPSGTKTVICAPLAETQGLGLHSILSGATFRGIPTPHLNYTGVSNLRTCTGNVAYFTAFRLDHTIVLSALAAQVATGVSSSVRLALYKVSHNGAAIKLCETSDLSTSSAGFISGSVTFGIVPAGWYYTGIGAKTTGVAMHAHNAGSAGAYNAGGDPLGRDASGVPYGFSSEAWSATDLPAVPALSSKTLITSEYPAAVFLVPA